MDPEGENIMKKTLSRILLAAAAFVLALSLCLSAQAEEAAPAAEAWLLYFASNHETDQAKFPWWPQHQKIDQPAEETGVEATNAIVTGPGFYTTALKFNWNKAEGAIQFNLIIKDAETLFSGYYCEITDIRVNGQSIEVKDNLYGAYHDEPGSGMVSIYNTYWDEKWGGTPGPDGHRAWDNEETAHWLIINPDDIVAGDTIEVDFMFAEKAGEKPDGAPALRVLKEGPRLHGAVKKLSAVSDIQLNAWMFFADGAWWPQRMTQDQTGNGVNYTDAVVTGQGSYTVGLDFASSGWHGNGANGISSSSIIITDGESKLPGSYVQITDIRVDGESVAFNNNLTAPRTWDNGDDAEGDDTAIPLYVSWMNDKDHNTWNRRDWAEDATCAVLDPSLINKTGKIEVDFIVTEEAGKQPEAPVLKYEYKWYPNNTMGVAGYSLRDMGITDKWYNIVPVDLTQDGIYKIPMVASNMFIIGNAIVTVEGDNVTVDYETQWASPGNMTISSECVKWFDEVADVTADFCADPQSELAFGEAISKAELGNVGYLFICNRVTYCQPIADNGIYLPRYSHVGNVWADYRAALDAMVAELGD